MVFEAPKRFCSLCPRLVSFREENIKKFPLYYNGAVESFGDIHAEILIVGLAPGLNGANQTGRPFTNDYAGDILYPTLKKHGLAVGNYRKKKDDDFQLVNVRITNAVRCVPPQNKVTGEESRMCGSFLQKEIMAMNKLKVILCLGGVAHNAVLGVLGCKKSSYKFVHGTLHHIQEPCQLQLLDSYHTSRYNINTGVLTAEMFDEIIRKAAALVSHS